MWLATIMGPGSERGLRECRMRSIVLSFGPLNSWTYHDGRPPLRVDLDKTRRFVAYA